MNSKKLTVQNNSLFEIECTKNETIHRILIKTKVKREQICSSQVGTKTPFFINKSIALIITTYIDILHGVQINIVGSTSHYVSNISSVVIREADDRNSSIDRRVCVIISSLFFTAEFLISLISVSILLITHSIA